ncbi:MAG TPA: tRNA-dihydrouridine synthase, partial [Candidatus Binatus sp.]|nr:tRNA-dihydrouridine synthase [Candidatus Binatus sp.]
VRVIASVFGFDSDEFADAARAGQDAGAIAVELNVSCPHVEEVGVEIGQSPRRVAEVVKAVKNRVNIPVIAKLTPNVTSIQEIAKAAEAAGADVLCAVNTALGMAIDIEAARPILGGVFGGLSGPALRPIAVRAVYQVVEAVKIPVIGAGGISIWKDAVEFLMAGASAVEIGTAVAAEGVGVFDQVSRGISNFLLEHGYRSVREIVGIAHKTQVPAS